MRLLLPIFIIVFVGVSTFADQSNPESDLDRFRSSCWAQTLANAKTYKAKARKIVRDIAQMASQSEEGLGMGTRQKYDQAVILLDAIASLQKDPTGSNLNVTEKAALEYLCSSNFDVEAAVSP